MHMRHAGQYFLPATVPVPVPVPVPAPAPVAVPVSHWKARKWILSVLMVIPCRETLSVPS